jgi:tetratricopeptide (TPR) repeat protein
MIARRLSLALLTAGCGAPPIPASQAPTSPPLRNAKADAGQLPPSVAALAKGAVLFDDLGTYHKAVTASPEAQIYFDQGLRLTYAFNHDEATRSYAHAAELDPSCAICFWGIALTLGPNYNVPMLPDRAQAAWDALERARALAADPSKHATPLEQALIGALGKRYGGPKPLDPPAMQPFNVAYAEAMRGVAAQFENDLDVQTLSAEAMMDVNPWKLWGHDGKPAPGTQEILATLERVLQRDVTHPGANHYFIHAIEASPHPERGLPEADRLPAMMPGAGHLVHMPAHIYQRVGRYADASAANTRAVAVDQAYMKRVTPRGYYPMYLGHNYGFLAFSASMEGRSVDAINAADQAAKALPPSMVDAMPGMDFLVAEPLLARVRFAKWDELVATPRPEAKYPVLTGFWLHAHGMALAAKGKLAEARADQAELAKLATSVPADLGAGNNTARDVLAVAAKILEARIAEAAKAKDALALWAEAVKLEGGLSYSEPDDWFYSVRTFQGAALLAAGQAREAEAVYRADLQQHPKNGWSLFGLAQSLRAQKKGKEAQAAKAELDQAWKAADVKLSSSVL